MSEKTVSIGIIGAGKRSTFLPSFIKQSPGRAVITAVYDEIPEVAEWFCRHHSLSDVTVFPSREALLSDPSVDAVFIGTPDHAHADAVCDALAAGKHVYGEKPLALTLEDCDRMLEASRKAHGIFYLGKNLRHAPVYQAVHGKLPEVGQILTLEANEHYSGGRTYFRRWNRLRRFGGGLWITKACHDFDILNWMAASVPVRVFATAALSYYRPRPEAGTHCRVCPVADTCPDNYARHPVGDYLEGLAAIFETATGEPRDLCLYNSDKDTFDNGIAVVEYANGIRASYTLNVVSAITTRRIMVGGTEGTLEGNLSSGIVTFTPRYRGEPEETDVTAEMKGGHDGADLRILSDFLDCCRCGRQPLTGAAEGRLSLQVGLAATLSSDTGEPVVVVP